MTETEVRNLSNEDLADLEQKVRAERERRDRLSSASAGIAGLLKSVKADGGDPTKVVSEACAAANVPTPGGVDTPVVNPSEKEPSSRMFGQAR